MAKARAHAPKEPASAAKAAGLRYRSDDTPGISRKAAGKGFTYTAPDGKRVKDEATLLRIRSLVIPPAWTKVWISPLESGHIQATGRDARGRKQYRYHARWREVRDETKYERMIAFGEALPRLRAKVDADMRTSGLSREKVIATVVKLLEATLIRVGNREYAVQNDSYGLTTLRDEHVDVDHAHLRFHFRGKSGVEHDVDIKDARLARIVARCQAIEGEELFQYKDESGARHVVESADVNAYIHSIAGEDFTAKDFRTFAGTVLFSQAVRAFESVDSQTRAKKNVVEAIGHVAERLGNTKAVCRRCYIHPVVIDAYLDGITVDTIKERADHALSEALKELTPEEAAAMMLVRQQLAARQHPKAA